MVDNNNTSKPAPDAMRVKLRKLVDAVWNDVTESTAVPSTKWADKLIDLVFTMCGARWRTKSVKTLPALEPIQ